MEGKLRGDQVKCLVDQEKIGKSLLHAEKDV
jgi:hypothetical protein